jgi:hypothetical protein
MSFREEVKRSNESPQFVCCRCRQVTEWWELPFITF